MTHTSPPGTFHSGHGVNTVLLDERSMTHTRERTKTTGRYRSSAWTIVSCTKVWPREEKGRLRSSEVMKEEMETCQHW